MNRLLIGLVLAGAALAQPLYRVGEWVVDAGGRRSTDASGSYVARGSFHQTTIGRPTDHANYVAWVGFWHPRDARQSRDAAVVEITAPGGSADTILLVTPSARLANYGSAYVTFPAWFTITRSNGTPVYRDSIAVTLGPGDVLMKTFDTLHFGSSGLYVARCSVGLSDDQDSTNNRLVHPFKVVGQQLPQGWVRVAPIPALPSSRPVRRGGWLAFSAAQNRVFAGKGNKAGDCYAYAPDQDRWYTLETMPAGPERKLPAAGATAASDGGNCVYALKGNGSLGFWRYDVSRDTWAQMPSIPAGPRNKKVKAGADACFVVLGDTGWVYATKGGVNEFWRFNTVAPRWESLPGLPTGASTKWDKGSWLAYDGSRTIYAQQAKYHTLCRFDVVGDTWYSRQCAVMPKFNNQTGKTTLAKDGSAAAWYDGCIYAFKGNNTQQFWRYAAATDSWTELETIPAGGNGSRPVKLKDGTDIASCGDGSLVAIKGNKSVEVWRYCQGSQVVAPRPGGRSGVMAEAAPGVRRPFLEIRPNPVLDRQAVVRWACPSSVRHTSLAVSDAAGRTVLERELPGRSGTFLLDLSELSPGAYFVRMPIGEGVVRERLVVAR